MPVINAAGINMSTPERPRGYNVSSGSEEDIVNPGPRYDTLNSLDRRNPFASPTSLGSAFTGFPTDNICVSPTRRTEQETQRPGDQGPDLFFRTIPPHDLSSASAFSGSSREQPDTLTSPVSPPSSSDSDRENNEELYRRFAENCIGVRTIILPTGQLFDIPIMKKSKSRKGSQLLMRGSRPRSKRSEVRSGEAEGSEVAVGDDDNTTVDVDNASSQTAFQEYHEGYEVTSDDWREGVKRDLDAIDKELPAGPIPPPYRNPAPTPDDTEGRDVYVPVQHAPPAGSSGVGRWEYENSAGAAMDLWIADIAFKAKTPELADLCAWMIRTRQANDIPRRVKAYKPGEDPRNPYHGRYVRTTEVDPTGELVNDGYSQMTSWDWMIEDAKDKRKFMKSERKYMSNFHWGIAEEAVAFRAALIETRGGFEHDPEGQNRLKEIWFTDDNGQRMVTIRDHQLGYRRKINSSLWIQRVADTDQPLDQALL